MTSSATNASFDRLIRQGVALEIFTISWMTLEASVAVVAGATAGSVALLAFGADSAIEFVAALVVLRAFRAEHGDRATAVSEQRALRIIGVMFCLLAAYIAGDAGYTLITVSKPDGSATGLAVAAAALLVMPPLGTLKRRTATALGSRTLLADAAESIFCAYLSATVLTGLLLNAIFGWWWADPAAALVVIPLVINEGKDALQPKPQDRIPRSLPHNPQN